MDYQRGEKFLSTIHLGYKQIVSNDGKDDYEDVGGYLFGYGLDLAYALSKAVDVETGVAHQYINDKEEAFDVDGNATSVIYNRVSPDSSILSPRGETPVDK